ncbi:hypothetical protein PC116_g7314 [Phytophthora cactorum]|nr:hypothetical protein PC116_g7314 [Phytophthora cactorum]
MHWLPECLPTEVIGMHIDEARQVLVHYIDRVQQLV